LAIVVDGGTGVNDDIIANSCVDAKDGSRTDGGTAANGRFGREDRAGMNQGSREEPSGTEFLEDFDSCVDLSKGNDEIEWRVFRRGDELIDSVQDGHGIADPVRVRLGNKVNETGDALGFTSARQDVRDNAGLTADADDCEAVIHNEWLGVVRRTRWSASAKWKPLMMPCGAALAQGNPRRARATVVGVRGDKRAFPRISSL
jgi:hypothetical protein